MMLEFEQLSRPDADKLHSLFETSGPATRGNAVNRSALDYVGGQYLPRKPVQLRASPEVSTPVASSRGEETDDLSILAEVALFLGIGLFLVALAVGGAVLNALISF